MLTRPGSRGQTQFVSKFSTRTKTYWTDFDGDALKFATAREAALSEYGVAEIKTLAAARAENLVHSRKPPNI